MIIQTQFPFQTSGAPGFSSQQLFFIAAGAALAVALTYAIIKAHLRNKNQEQAK